MKLVFNTISLPCQTSCCCYGFIYGRQQGFGLVISGVLISIWRLVGCDRLIVGDDYRSSWRGRGMFNVT